MDKIFVKCNNCNSDNYTVVFKEGKAQIHQVVKCNNCGLMYSNPQTTYYIEGKVAINSEEGIDIENLKKGLDQFAQENEQYLKKQHIHQKDFATIFNFFNDRQLGKLLEIGSYSGVFLNSAKERGWDVLGIEPDHLARLYSESKYNIKVLPDSFESADLKENSFDVVIATHVIEHIYNPRIFVERANFVLKQKGVLILETPTYDTFTYWLLKHRERSMRCNGHIYFYTKKTLKKLVEDSGFKVVKHIKVGRTLTLDRLLTNFGIMAGKRDFFEKISNKLKLDKVIIHINARDMQRIYCEKI